MSGHSKWSQIKHGKETADKRRGMLFNKLIKTIIVAAREGKDPQMNFKLKLAIDRAKSFNMPKENIERAIERNELSKEKIEEIFYEGFGPFGIALIIKAITDNRSRTNATVKNILKKYDGRLGEEGSVKWMFDQFSVMVCQKEKNLEDLELKAIEAGAEEIKEKENKILIYAKLKDSKKIKENLEKQGIKIESIEIDWLGKNSLFLEKKEEKEKIEKLINELLEIEEVEEIYSNLKNSAKDETHR